MNSSDSPTRIVKAFGVNGSKNTIPVESNSSTTSNGVATFDTGFPPITMQPLSAGGIPPSGRDFNGVLYTVTLQQQWQNAGMTYAYNSNFATQINGYPKGAIIPSSVYTGQWLNLNESNSNTPESQSGAYTGWVPINNYGVTTVSGLSNQSVTLSSLQAAKDRIVLTGTLTSNINIIFPTWIKSWVVVNNCTGNFTVTCKTSSGDGITAVSGLVSRIFCDGINITDETYNPNNDMVGAVVAFAMNSAPTGWLIADGSEKSRTTYARLFSRIGTTFGSGDGVTTFNLPAMGDEFVRGASAARDVGTKELDAVQNATATLNDVLMGASASSSGAIAISATGFKTSVSTGTQPTQFYNTTLDLSKSVRTSTETRPRSISLLYCIKY